MAGRVGQSGRWRALRGVLAAAAMSLPAPVLGQDVGPLVPAPQPPAPAAPVAPAASSEDRGLGIPGSARPGAPNRAAAPAPNAGKSGMGQMIAALAGVLGLAVVAAGVVRVLMRRTGGFGGGLGAGGRAPAGVMEILGRYPVGRGATLVLLKLDKRILLLSQTAGGRFGAGAGFNTLCDITDAEEVASILVKTRDAEGDSMSERFRSILGRFDRNLDAAESEASGRRVAAGGAGDRVELWDDRQQIPVVDLTKQPGPPDASAAGSLRRRLASMRWTGSGEGGA